MIEDDLVRPYLSRVWKNIWWTDARFEFNWKVWDRSDGEEARRM